MTAEVVVMNKMAVALAADSAVTLSVGEGHKIYNTVNKLFALSKYQPVGVMLYGNAVFMGIPWETVFKTYRFRLGDRQFPTLKGYAEDFTAFLEAGNLPLSDDDTRRFVESVIRYNFQRISGQIKGQAKAKLEKGELAESELESMVVRAVTDYCSRWAGYKRLDGVTEDYGTGVIATYRSVVDSIRNSSFENLPLSAHSVVSLDQLVVDLFTKDEVALPGLFSGLVVAGFGSQEVSLQRFKCSSKG